MRHRRPAHRRCRDRALTSTDHQHHRQIKLGPVPANVGELEDAWVRHDVVIPLEFNGLRAPGDSDRTKFALYLGPVQPGPRHRRPRVPPGKTLTTPPRAITATTTTREVRPGHAEDLTNRMDDDCDGRADNPGKHQAADRR